MRYIVVRKYQILGNISMPVGAEADMNGRKGRLVNDMIDIFGRLR